MYCVDVTRRSVELQTIEEFTGKGRVSCCETGSAEERARASRQVALLSKISTMAWVQLGRVGGCPLQTIYCNLTPAWVSTSLELSSKMTGTTDRVDALKHALLLHYLLGLSHCLCFAALTLYYNSRSASP